MVEERRKNIKHGITRVAKFLENFNGNIPSDVLGLAVHVEYKKPTSMFLARHNNSRIRHFSIQPPSG
jgi:hypothetical protein